MAKLDRALKRYSVNTPEDLNLTKKFDA